MHFIEGNFITPMVQAEATSFPPVLAILSTVAFSILFGPLGVLLAAPLTLLVIAAAEVLYVQQGLGEAPEQDAMTSNSPSEVAPPSGTQATDRKVAADRGLTAAEAAARLLRYGRNELPQERQRGMLRIVLEAVREPMLLMLLGTGALYLVIGDLAGALILLAFAVLNVLLVVVRQSRTERAFATLEELTSPGAFFIRDGVRLRIEGGDVLVGDIIALVEGDRVPADAHLLAVTDLEADESLLTGESVPVRKALSESYTSDVRPGGDGTASVWSSSLVVRGTGLARVLATRARTEIGLICTSLGAVDSAPTPLQIQTRKLVKIFAIFGIGSSAALAFTYGLLHGEWIKGILAGITLAMATLPEQFHALVEYSILASRPEPFDPMESVFFDFGEQFLKKTEHIYSDWMPVHGYPLKPELLAMSQVWQARGRTGFVVAAKGAPEAIADLCHLPADQIDAVHRDVASLAARGLRVLAVARGKTATDAWPDTQHDFDLAFVGLVGLADPLRPEVPAAVAAYISGGIRVVMITGDHPATALTIARQAGITGDDVLTGADMAGLDDAKLEARLGHTNIFAFIMPEQKLRLVQAFAASGQIVVMTGNGVNDTPSLKAAHIGVAMGGRGSDVAREAASLVLLDGNFASLVTAVRLGRRIADNLRKAMGYILVVHVPIAGMSLLLVLLGWPMVLGPIHVVFLELIIDPVSSIVFEAEPDEDGIMARPPRKPDAPLFDTALMLHGLLQGVVVLVAALGMFQLGIHDPHGEEVARSMAFVTVVIGNLGLVLTNRSLKTSAFLTLTRPYRALVLVVITTFAALALAFSAPWLRGLFGFAPLALDRLAAAAGAALVCLAVNDLAGMIWRWLAHKAETKEMKL